ncbi:Lysophospholipase [Drechslerella dactyloides]|uniref:Lysophospholipase n=1 Tax=Drechslerella dactyloides TaxID=74499 RepID=A0AAD6IRZ5_DREDA|nr:Lysophospholipase [Drechslerella dactyloides]
MELTMWSIRPAGVSIHPSVLLAIWLCLLTSIASALPPPRHQTTTGRKPSRRNLETRDLLDSIKNLFDFDDVTGYGPFQVTNPREPIVVRDATELAREEAAWLAGRKKVANAALVDFLGRVDMKDFDHKAFLSGYTPTVGLAFSGGGYRAMLNGAGVINAFDARSPKSMKPGGLGGLLQGSTYLSGLSGGGWLVGTLAVNGFPSIEQILSSKRLWKLEDSIVSPFGKPLSYYPSIFAQAKEKSDAGFDITLTDIWSLMLARVFIDQPDGGPKTTLSGVAESNAFKSFEMPFPIFIALGRAPGEKSIGFNTTVFEINPLEFGSHDPTVAAFTKTRLLGSDYSRGRPEAGGKFINGFDNAAFIMGTSSSLFNQFLLDINHQDSSVFGGKLVKDLVVTALEFLSQIEIDIADWAPNPFFGVRPERNPAAATKNLTLVDGGMDLENIPFNPLLCPHRRVDVIFATDSSADVLKPNGDTLNWPNGTAIIATYERFKNKFMSANSAFPSIPDINTFINQGLNSRPTWFGCDAKNFSGPISPLVVYLPNAPYDAFSNISTFRLSLENEERDSVINNGYQVATQGDGRFDREWSACVGCAVIHREMERRGTITEQCKRCLKRYCWDGVRNSTAPATYAPDLKMRSAPTPLHANGTAAEEHFTALPPVKDEGGGGSWEADEGAGGSWEDDKGAVVSLPPVKDEGGGGSWADDEGAGGSLPPVKDEGGGGSWEPRPDEGVGGSWRK